jgi:hypothetical protein
VKTASRREFVGLWTGALMAWQFERQPARLVFTGRRRVEACPARSDAQEFQTFEHPEDTVIEDLASISRTPERYCFDNRRRDHSFNNRVHAPARKTNH